MGRAADQDDGRRARGARRPNAKAEPPAPLCSPLRPTPPTQADTRALRAEYGSKARETTKTHKAAETEWQHKVNREKSAGVFKLRELVHKDRAAQKQDAVSRRDAEADAEAMATRVRERETSLERLRGTRQQTLLDTIEEERAAFAEQTASNMATIVELTRRRTANMRKILDYNLSNRRAAQATETAKQAQQALNDYCVRDLASDIDLAWLEEVEAELVATHAELAKEKALRVEYEPVAYPLKKYFFESGAYTAAVDVTIIRLIADCGIASRAVPELFQIFAIFFKVTLLGRTKKVQVARSTKSGASRCGSLNSVRAGRTATRWARWPVSCTGCR